MSTATLEEIETRTKKGEVGILQKFNCLNRLQGRCPDCTKDYNPNHHPNNYDCPRHKPVECFDVVDVFYDES